MRVSSRASVMERGPITRWPPTFENGCSKRSTKSSLLQSENSKRFRNLAAATRVLFVCIHNSARSQMAEAFLNARKDAGLEAYSAGLERGELNPVVVQVMREAGIDISQNRTKRVGDPDIASRDYDYVITV